MSGEKETFVHETAIIEEGVEIGRGTRIWDNVHIRKNTIIGESCIIGEKTYIAYDVKIGNKVKINSHVYICTGIEVGDGVMISAGVIFTNDRFPRAVDPDTNELLPSEPGEHTERTIVMDGVTVGAGAVVGPGITIGRWAMVGMGAVVTRDVPNHGLVIGNPAKLKGYVCKCGKRLEKTENVWKCLSCQRIFIEKGDGLVEK